MAFSATIALLMRPQALVGALFLALGAGIVANALLLQPEQHPAPLVQTRADIDAAAVRGDELVLAVQKELREAGYYSGPLDGVAGTLTQAAISSFEASQGRNPTGAASFELLSTLRAFNRGGNSAAAPPAEKVAPDDRVAAVQDALARAAYGPLTADGVFGPQTRDAIMRFQQDHGLPVTGAISDALVVELRAAGALETE